MFRGTTKGLNILYLVVVTSKISKLKKDQGPCFEANLFQEICQLLRIHKPRTSAKYERNGQETASHTEFSPRQGGLSEPTRLASSSSFCDVRIPGYGARNIHPVGCLLVEKCCRRLIWF